jgi:hypothetical protein
VLRQFGWALPTSAEFEWALRGGVDGLFYWGNAIPLWLAREQGVEPEPDPADPRSTADVTFQDLMDQELGPGRPRRWPWCNRFGLAALLASSTWCEPAGRPEDAKPLVFRGGVAECYPWQYCREWMRFLSAVESCTAERDRFHLLASHCVRLIRRLRADPAVLLR